MSRLQRLTPKRIERLKEAVIKDFGTYEVSKDMDVLRDGFTAVCSIKLEDGRTLFLNTRDTEDMPEVEVTIRPKKKGGE